MSEKRTMNGLQEYDWGLLMVGEGRISAWQLVQLFSLRYMAAMETDDTARRQIMERGNHVLEQLLTIAGDDGASR